MCTMALVVMKLAKGLLPVFSMYLQVWAVQQDLLGESAAACLELSRSQIQGFGRPSEISS